MNKHTIKQIGVILNTDYPNDKKLEYIVELIDRPKSREAYQTKMLAAFSRYFNEQFDRMPAIGKTEYKYLWGIKDKIVYLLNLKNISLEPDSVSNSFYLFLNLIEKNSWVHKNCTLLNIDRQFNSILSNAKKNSNDKPDFENLIKQQSNSGMERDACIRNFL